MNQLYYRDLRRRVKALEAHYFPKQEEIPLLIFSGDDDGLPVWVFRFGEFDWTRHEGEPIPPEILELADPEARAAYEARLAAEARAPKAPAERAPPES